MIFDSPDEYYESSVTRQHHIAVWLNRDTIMIIISVSSVCPNNLQMILVIYDLLINNCGCVHTKSGEALQWTTKLNDHSRRKQ